MNSFKLVITKFLLGMLGTLIFLTNSNFMDAKPKFALLVGPYGIGSGGTNPISIPPFNLPEYEFVILEDSLMEWRLGLIPGVFYGKRTYLSDNFYASLGAGLVVSHNGVGPGVNLAVGYETCGSTLCFEANVEDALGITSNKWVSPFALRLGMGWGIK